MTSRKIEGPSAPAEKQQHVFDRACPLVSLPADALTAVLCRVPAADLPAVRTSCKTLNSTVGSDMFKAVRATTGWSEVSARLVPGDELYDRENPDGPDMWDVDDFDSLPEEEKNAKIADKRAREIEEYYSDLGHCDGEYSYHSIHVEVTVDGDKTAGQISLILIPRPKWGGHSFHAAADAHSRELQEVGWRVCDSRGRPQLRSIKEADKDGSAKFGGYIHVVEVNITNDAYKKNTNVVGHALRAALTLPELRNKWTLATAMADARLFMSKDDANRKREVARKLDWQDSGEDIVALMEEKQRLEIRFKECGALDARAFMRVGYRQIPEVVGSDRHQPAWLFALPSFLDGPLLSHDDVMEMKLIELDLPQEPINADKILFDIVKRALNDRKQKADSVAYLERDMNKRKQLSKHQWDESSSNIESFAELTEATDERLRQLEDMMRETNGESISQVTNQLSELRSQLENLKNLQKKQATTFEEYWDEHTENENRHISNLNAELLKVDEDLKGQVASLVNERGASIRKSYVLHCSARFLYMGHFDFLLQLVPKSERAQAVNDLDTNGSTPLHCVVMGMPELSDAKNYHDAVRHLIDLGADKGVTDASGRTPLGQYRAVKRSKNDFMRAFGLSASLRDGDDADEAWAVIQGMEASLMPPGGETQADRDINDVQPSSEVEEEMDFMLDEDADA
ncbi:hypothetical protein THAOC_06057 [Thalassiosira oceanica]|uniref:F-box domain-containing protein n=1 Tax=Thalassiosira oceanica TaxID=159749 RepID=K0TFP1_THAOC|nr:hypothetical protein THAOC_06057 [Thalassiosira oceanica]|eukprot:EJK72416.1 hypothetical protein THAOC_06057 [Thalassiosira oceanica]